MIQRRTALLGLAAAALAPQAMAKGKAGFKTLFDGKSLKGWTPIGDANWTLQDGVVSADKGRGMLVSAASYKDFDLRAEVWVSPEANSGIFIRCSDRATVTQNNAYEVNIYDTRPDPAYGTGGIVDVAKVSPMPKAGGRWNVMEISAHGDVLSVVFNGQKTVDAVRNSLYAEGPIALQYGAGVVKFRRVDIRTA
jgi:hypothetical protein